jgi:hypothetical protein
LLIIAVLAIGAAVIAFGAPDWWMAARPGAVTDGAPALSLPIITTSEAALVRARTLQAQGRLRDAAAALEVIAADDPARREADQVLTEIQDALLAAIVR